MGPKNNPLWLWLAESLQTPLGLFGLLHNHAVTVNHCCVSAQKKRPVARWVSRKNVSYGGCGLLYAFRKINRLRCRSMGFYNRVAAVADRVPTNPAVAFCGFYNHAEAVAHRFS